MVKQVSPATVRVKVLETVTYPISNTQRLHFVEGDTYPSVDRAIAEKLEQGKFLKILTEKEK